MKTIHIQTPIPGPQSQALMARRRAAVSDSPFIVTPIFAERGRGAALVDVDGNTFLDFAGGIGTLNVGHAHPEVVAAIQSQAERLVHTCFNVAEYEPYIELAERLNEIVPTKGPRKSVLFNSGAEAVENAVKIARNVTRRSGVVAFEHGFAGRTYMALTMTSKASPYKAGFGPFMPEVYRLPYPYFYRSDFRDEDAFVDEAIEEFQEFFYTHVDAKQVACVCIELITGEGGFIVAPKRYVQELARFCEQHGIVLIVDEIQTGFGRTGTMFVTEQYGIQPDLITLAKSLAGGLPLSAVVGRRDLLDGVQVGGLGGTYGGNPIACAAALAAIDIYERDDIPAHAARLGERLFQRLETWAEQIPTIGDIRGVGAMRAVEFVKDRATKEPNKDLMAALGKRCYENGVILIAAGTHSNVLRFLFPLVITEAQLDEGLDVIEQQLELLSPPA